MTRYVVIENTPGYLPEDGDPFVGPWDTACGVMDDIVGAMVDDGWTVEYNDGVGFRLPGGTRRTYLLPPDAHEHSLSRVVEVLPAVE